MRISCKGIFCPVASVVLGMLLFLGNAAAADKETLTGEVSDAMCGAQHAQGPPRECTRACVGHGSKYLLVVGDKLYSLNTSDNALLAVLDQQAGKKATVTGTVNGVGVEVSSVVPVK
ncbi:MAG TPA: hypothetical protein VHW45_05140 [Candidatus Sulfotelmatobacter sp.]|jgi:hypothetical protein|nr:hypothetical protein [Candidatus Sulfotelmatobacter sp.]